MLFFKSFPKLSFLTATSIASSFLIINLPVKAANLSFAESILLIDYFNISPQNPSVESNSQTVTFSRNEFDFVETNAEVDTIFEADSDAALLNTNWFSEALGEGNSFFGFGESSSLAVGNFAIDAGHTLSFNFLTSLYIFNQVDSPLGGSASSFSSVHFSVRDEHKNSVLGEFTAISSVNTNLAEDIGQDPILIDSSNVSFGGSKYEYFGEDIELAELFLHGSFEQFFAYATTVRLEAATFSRSCVQAPLTNDPCPKVPEPNNNITLLLGFLGLGLVSKLVARTKLTKD